jgi:hypothetical protein
MPFEDILYSITKFFYHASHKINQKPCGNPLVHLAKFRGLVSDSHAIPKKADGIRLAQVMGGGVSVEAALVAFLFRSCQL